MHRLTTVSLSLITFSALLGALSSPIIAQEPTDFFANNGSFEHGDLHGGIINLFGCNPHRDSNCSSNGRLLFSSTRLDGWLMSGRANWHNNAPQDGHGYISLTATGGREHYSSSASFYGYDLADKSLISHTPFTIGDLYELSFWAAGGGGTVNRLKISVNMRDTGGVSETFLFPGGYTTEEMQTSLDWQHFTIPLTATNETMSLQFTSGGSNLFYEARSTVFVDNVTLTRVPEPSGAIFVLLGSAVFNFCRNRRNPSIA